MQDAITAPTDYCYLPEAEDAMIKQMAHACIGATDLEKTEKFYCEALGLKKKFDFIKGGKVHGFYIDLGNNSFLEVFPEDKAVDQNCPIIRHLCFEVEGLTDMIARLRALGIEASDAKVGGDGSYQSWIKDPSGVRIELHEYTESSSQLTGQPCIMR